MTGAGVVSAALRLTAAALAVAAVVSGGPLIASWQRDAGAAQRLNELAFAEAQSAYATCMKEKEVARKYGLSGVPCDEPIMSSATPSFTTYLPGLYTAAGLLAAALVPLWMAALLDQAAAIRRRLDTPSDHPSS